MGPMPSTMGAPLYSYFCLRFSSPLCQLPFYSTGPRPNSLTVSSNGPWHSETPAHLRTAGVLTGYSHDLTPFCPLNGHLPADLHTQGAWIRAIREGEEGGRGLLYFQAKYAAALALGAIIW